MSGWSGHTGRAILAGVAHGRSETPLLGREDDLTRIVRATEPGGLVVLAGPAGIGKTRLVAELVRAATTAGGNAVVGHCVGQAGAAIPYLPFSELLARLEARDVAALDEVLERHPVLSRLLPGHAPAQQEAPDPGVIAEAVHAALTAAGARHRILLVIEDVHWADHSTRDLLTLLLTRGFTTDVSLLLTYRSDDLHRRHPLHETLAVWARLEGVHHLQLGPLPGRAIRDLVLPLVAAPSAALVADIIRRSEGNPFFAEELAAASDGHALTDTLTRVLLARYDGLDARAKGLLRAIAAHGRHITHELLARVVPLAPDELDESLRAAIDGGVLTVDRTGGYAFRHALLAEAIGEDLLPGERTRLHRAYVAALLDDDALAPASDLEHHAAAAGDVPTAVAAAIRAGRTAFAMGGPRDALDHFERALTWMDEDHPERDAVTLEAARAAHTSGDVARAIQILADRLEHPGTRQEPDDRAHLLAAYARQARYSERERGSAGERAAEAYALVSPAPTAARLEVLLAHLEHLIDERRFAEAAPIGEEARALAAGLGLDGAEIELRTVLVRGMYRTGDLETMESNLRHAIADGRGDSSVQVLGCSSPCWNGPAAASPRSWPSTTRASASRPPAGGGESGRPSRACRAPASRTSWETSTAPSPASRRTSPSPPRPWHPCAPRACWSGRPGTAGSAMTSGRSGRTGTRRTWPSSRGPRPSTRTLPRRRSRSPGTSSRSSTRPGARTTRRSCASPRSSPASSPTPSPPRTARRPTAGSASASTSRDVPTTSRRGPSRWASSRGCGTPA